MTQISKAKRILVSIIYSTKIMSHEAQILFQFFYLGFATSKYRIIISL